MTAGARQERKYIVSASRRTDLLACNPDRMNEILNGRIKTFAKLRPEKIHTLLISTKDFTNFLDHKPLAESCRRCEQVCFNLTVTGLGGTALEPHVPPPQYLLPRLEELVDAVGSPGRVTWCFDPVITYQQYSNMSVELFSSLAGSFARAGVQRVMAMYYYPYGNSRISPEELSASAKRSFADELEAICRDMGLLLSFCHVPPYHRLRCVDMDYLARVHPNGDSSLVQYYQKQKKPGAGHCRDPIWDIGWYLPRCRHGCLYCYGKADV